MINNYQIKQKIVVAIPCLNEEATVGKVVADFKKLLPMARVVVFDNNSTDRTAELARAAGAEVMIEEKRGKGQVVRAIFEKIEADVYVLVDGDDTYPADEVGKLLTALQNNHADMVVGARLQNFSKESYQWLYGLGNRWLLKLLNICFQVKMLDILSGYRILNRELVKGVPLFSTGFTIETELTLQSLIRGFRIKEIPISYKSRPKGGQSKIRAWRDGYQILMTILIFTRDYRPMIFFPVIGFIFIIGAFIPGFRVIYEYLETGLIRYVPSAILATGLMILGILFFVAGFIIHTLNRRFSEIYFTLKRMKK